jgi:glycosyltransferase involved in cell wall biosynthesis
VPGQTGFLVPANDAGGFARQLTLLAQDQALRRRMGEAARVRALTYSWEETLARMLGYYRALLAGTAST